MSATRNFKTDKEAAAQAMSVLITAIEKTERGATHPSQLRIYRDGSRYRINGVPHGILTYDWQFSVYPVMSRLGRIQHRSGTRYSVSFTENVFIPALTLLGLQFTLIN